MNPLLDVEICRFRCQGNEKFGSVCLQYTLITEFNSLVLSGSSSASSMSFSSCTPFSAVPRAFFSRLYRGRSLNGNVEKFMPCWHEPFDSPQPSELPDNEAWSLQHFKTSYLDVPSQGRTRADNETGRAKNIFLAILANEVCRLK